MTTLLPKLQQAVKERSTNRQLTRALANCSAFGPALAGILRARKLPDALQLLAADVSSFASPVLVPTTYGKESSKEEIQ